MTETEFISLIDCRFPYHDCAESRRLIELGCSISSNAAFSIIEELARIPKSGAVATSLRAELLLDISNRFEHPVKDLVVGVTKRLINGEHLSLPETLQAMNAVGAFRNEYCALNVIYFSVDDHWEDVDFLYDEITERWKVVH